MHLSDTSSVAQHLKKTFMPNNTITEDSYRQHNIRTKKKNKQKLQILEALHIRNMQPTLIRINFQTSANVLTCI